MSHLAALWAPPRAVVVPPPLEATWPRLSLDVSNWQGALADSFFETWSAQGYGGLIVQSVLGSDGKTFTQQQLQAAVEHDWAIAAYVWCAPGDAQTGAVNQRLSYLAGFEDRLAFVALDVEQGGTAAADVDFDLQVLALLNREATPMYTAYWFFENQGWLDLQQWAWCRLWDARYMGEADPDLGFRAYGGWSAAWLTQFTDTPLDQNVGR